MAHVWRVAGDRNTRSGARRPDSFVRDSQRDLNNLNGPISPNLKATVNRPTRVIPTSIEFGGQWIRVEPGRKPFAVADGAK